MKRTHRTIAVAAPITTAGAMAAAPAHAAKSITFTLGNQSSPISSYSWGATNAVSVGSAGGGAGSGKVKVEDFHMVKDTDAMSISLARATFTGQHLQAAALTFNNDPFTSAYCFKDVFVTAFQNGATAGQDRPVDQVSLAFAQVAFKVGTDSFNWDITENGGAENVC